MKRATRAAFADSLLGDWLLRYRWFRRWVGGHFERWWLDVPVTAELWLRRAHGTRPPLGRGTPVCEDWPERET